MRRREFIILLAVMATPIAALAQEPGKIRHIGFLRVGPPPSAFIEGFRRGLRELGYLEGQHFVIEYGLAESVAQIPDAAAELVRRRVDVIVAADPFLIGTAITSLRWQRTMRFPRYIRYVILPLLVGS